jgi:hypothetical protein
MNAHSKPVRHYAVTSYLLGEYETEEVPVCGNDFHRRKKLTADPALVTCPTCLRLCGFEQFQATVCEGDPMLRRAA